MSKVQYANAVVFLIYATVCTCLDLAQAVSVVSRYMANPAKQHWNAVKWIFRYLKGTKKLGILFERQQRKTCVSGYVDSYYAGDIEKRRSTARYVFTCGGGLISWRVVLQSITALSTIEAEYMGLTEASKEALWLTRLAKEFGIAQDLVVIQSNSQTVICLVKNQVFHRRSKNIDVRYHRIRDSIEVELLGITRTVSKRFEEFLGVNNFHKVFKARQGEDC
ncbi:secreted RxLR effector protein 161-like [Prunus dulcis]|uniref:secreted RxLR effector protein 161-like n=1 Tax=Prunus dulcis TaxID=3755 RepID=UPI0014835617|nr:secreted RxLR effector protein 161-like [Prunus dulcis]